MEKVFAHSTIAMDTMRRGQQPTLYFDLFFNVRYYCFMYYPWQKRRRHADKARAGAI